MKYRILIAILSFVTNTLVAQETIEEAVRLIEKNNITLSALRLEASAGKIGNHTGLLPENPEAGFNFLWGKPDELNNRTDFSISQSFDFPSAYIYRNRIANLKDEQAELNYLIRRNELLTEAWQVCADLLFHNALNVLLNDRLNHAKDLAGIYKKRLETGDANILEYNKAQINLLMISRKFEENELEKKELQIKLSSLNGDQPIDFNSITFPIVPIEPDFDKWYASAQSSNPEIMWLNREVAVAEKQEQLSRSLWLPQLSAGYMSEALPGETFRGVSVGMTIPLWHNRNTVKYAKVRNDAAAQFEKSRNLLFRSEMQSAHSRIMKLQIDLIDYRKMLSSLNNTAFIDKALNSGQISLTEYLLELSYYYEANDQLLELEYDLMKAIGEVYPYIRN